MIIPRKLDCLKNKKHENVVNWTLVAITEIRQYIEEANFRIKQWNNMFNEISQQKDNELTIKDFAILNAECGDKRYYQGLIPIYKRRLKLLQTGYFKSADEYYRSMIIQ